MSNFWDVLWLIASAFFFVAYLIVLFQVVIDLFRDAELGGGSKVLWLVGLIFPPMLTALYILVRGSGTAAGRAVAGQDRYRCLHPGSGGKITRRPHRRRQGAARCRRHQPGGIRQAQGQGAGVTRNSGKPHCTVLFPDCSIFWL